MSGIHQSNGYNNATAPSASSFLSAMAQLNQQYPPPQNQTNQYPPLQPNLQPNAALVPPSSSSTSLPSEGQVSPTTQSLPALHPQQSRPTSTGFSFEYLYGLAMNVFDSILNDWEVHPLSAEEIEAERLDIQQRLAKIHLLEAKIAQLHPAVHLGLEREYFVAKMEYRTRVLRTFRINDLPIEVLGRIFRIVLVPPASNPSLAIRERTALTSVCHHWRAVGLSDVTLWNYLWFRKFSLYEQCFEYLQRAKNAVLDVSINDSKEEPLTLEIATSLAARLFTKVSNIRTLVIVVEDWDPALCFLHSLLRVGKQGIPMILERFELHRAGSQYIQVGSGYEPSFYIQPMALFGGAHIPTLRHVVINAVYIDWDKSVLTDLTTLDLRRLSLNTVPTSNRFQNMLKKCRKLSKLVLDAAGPEWKAPPEANPRPVSPVTLPQLKTLLLGNFNAEYGVYLLDHFRAPNVVELTLTCFYGSEQSTFFRRMIGQTPLVKSLTLHSPIQPINPAAYPSLVLWLQSMPALTYLRMINVHQNFLDLFLYDPKTLHLNKTKDPLCSKLAYLEIHYVDPETSLNPGHISHWARFRAHLGASLRKIYIGPETVKSLGSDKEIKLAQSLRGVGTILDRLKYKYPPEERELLQML